MEARLPVERKDSIARMRRDSNICLVLSILLLIVCEALLGLRLWLKQGPHFQDLFGYSLPLYALAPGIVGISFRWRVKKWEADGHLIPAAAGRIKWELGFLLMVTYFCMAVIMGAGF
jgi:hypothetical protein